MTRPVVIGGVVLGRGGSYTLHGGRDRDRVTYADLKDL
jgi:hypothetical protein